MKNTVLPIVLSLCLVGAAASNAVAETTNAAPAPAVPPAAPLVAHSSTLTPEEWQELRAARMAALKATPDFVAKAAQLSAKIRAFQEKLDAAMLKTDPKLAPVLAKYASPVDARNRGNNEKRETRDELSVRDLKSDACKLKNPTFTGVNGISIWRNLMADIASPKRLPLPRKTTDIV